MSLWSELASPEFVMLSLPPMLIGALAAMACALPGNFLLLRRQSMMGDAISHAVLPGVVAAYLLGIPLIVGAFIAGMFCALATGFLSDNSRVKQDTVMGIVFSGMFGLGIVMYTKVSTDVHLDHILFGNMLGVGTTDLWTAGLIALFVAAIVIAKRQDFLLHAFDPIQAQAVGLRVGWLHYGLLALISLTIVATLSAVGIILSIGLLIAYIARFIGSRGSSMRPGALAHADNSNAAPIAAYVRIFICCLICHHRCLPCRT